jgi:DNA-binding LacI/PurR family transcriptional regulator
LFQYERIAQELKQRIERGEYPTGRVPAERALSSEFGVQRDTIRRALESLTENGVLLRDSTRGTYIAPRYLAAEASRLMPQSDSGGGGVLLVVRTFEDTTAPSAVFRGLSRRLAEEGIPAYWFDPGDKNDAALAGGPDKQLPPQAMLTERGIQGIVLWPRVPTPLEELRALRTALPLVLLDRRVAGLETDFVGFRDHEGGRSITEHLLDLGHRRIGFLSGEPQATAVQARLAGYAAALDAAGIRSDPALVLHQEGGSRLLSPAVVEAFLSGYGNPLTAVVCANDTVAARLIRFVRGWGKRVPEDVAVTGFGDLLPSMLDAFGITTVGQQFEEMGRAAGDVLLARLRGEAGSDVREIELPMRLIVRESCGSLLRHRVVTG